MQLEICNKIINKDPYWRKHRK